MFISGEKRHKKLSFFEQKTISFFNSSKWAAAGAGDPLPDQSTFLHPESPASGKSWMSQNPIMFDKLKLTNNRYLKNNFTKKPNLKSILTYPK